jgi:hypothetical protein
MLVWFETGTLWPPVRVHRSLNGSLAPRVCVVKYLLVPNETIYSDPSTMCKWYHKHDRMNSCGNCQRQKGGGINELTRE